MLAFGVTTIFKISFEQWLFSMFVVEYKNMNIVQWRWLDPTCTTLLLVVIREKGKGRPELMKVVQAAEYKIGLHANLVIW